MPHCFIISVANIQLIHPAAARVPLQHHLLARPCISEAMCTTGVSLFLILPKIINLSLVFFFCFFTVSCYEIKFSRSEIGHEDAYADLEDGAKCIYMQWSKQCAEFFKNIQWFNTASSCMFLQIYRIITTTKTAITILHYMTKQ